MVGGRKEIKLNRSVSSSLKIQYKSKRQRIARALLKKKTGELSPSCVKTSYCAGDSHVWVQGWTSRHLHTHTHTHTHKYQADKCELVQPLWKNSMEYRGSSKTKSRVAIWFSNPTTGHIPRQNYNSERYMRPCVYTCTSHNSQDVEAV